MVDGLVDELVGVVGAAHVLVDADVRAPYEVDWTRRFTGTARCVVRPADVDEVAGVLRACAAAGAAVVPQGGNTGLVGGGVPRGGEVVLSLVRLDGLSPVDAVAAEVTAGAGVTLGRLQAHARDAGLDFGVDLAARDSATVGGMVATNAGGVHALRYGPMRAQVVGLQAVLADGTVLERMPGLMKDNTGYDLPGLLVGSEGTLAVVTAARLRLRPLHTARVVAVLAVGGTAEALAVLGRLRSELASLDAVEVFHADGLDLVLRHTGVAAPFAAHHPTYLLVECAARQDPTDELVAVLADAPEVLDAAVATDGPGRARLWAMRERHTEAISAEGIPHKLDVTLPLGQLARFEERLRPLLVDVAPDARAILFGHLGDGNIHVNLLGIEPDDERADEAVLRLVAELGGSISAEHGIGVAKARWLGLTRSPTDIATMAAIKSALDPRHRLNPGVIFEH
jgi:FAD/FMN-containing dehydrogenase